VTIDYAQVAIQRDDFTKNNDMFDRLLARDDIAVVALLENKRTGSRLIVANTHLFWNPMFRDVKLIQAGILIDSLNGIAQWFAQLPPPQHPLTNGDASSEAKQQRPPPPTYSDPKDIPLIVSGDFNSIHDSGVYSFISDGKVPSTHPDFMEYEYGKFIADGLRHDFGLRSVYADASEVPITNHVPHFKEAIDYIFHNTSALSVNKVLGEVDPDYLSKVVGLPNAHFPSEWVNFVAIFNCCLPSVAYIVTSVSQPSSVSRRDQPVNRTHFLRHHRR